MQSTQQLIPRITLRPKDREFPFEWSRRQFPVRVAFAMTINKSQGQTLQNVGVWLNEPCFAHGQLYVYISRVGSPNNLKFAIRQVDSCRGYLTSNVVFKEVLVKGRVQKIILLTIKTNYSFSLSVTHVSEETKSWYSNR